MIQKIWLVALALLPFGIFADFDSATYVDFNAGTLPLILAVPHDGTDALPGVPERNGAGGTKNFNTSRDTNTALFARNVAAEIERQTGKRPYVVIMKLARKWVDANRKEINAFENEQAGQVYRTFYARVAEAKREILANYGKGLLLDIHCGGSWKHDVYFGTGRGKAIAPLTGRSGKDAFTGKDGLPSLMADLGYEIPGYKGVTFEHGPTGNLIQVNTWDDAANNLDGIEIEIQRKRHLHKQERIQKISTDFAAAVTKFLQAYYL